MDDALSDTHRFYRDTGGFGYSEEKVIAWLSRYTSPAKKRKILGLCRGDGIW